LTPVPGDGSADAAPVLVIAATDMELAPLLAAVAESRATPGRWGPASTGRVGSTPVVLQALGLGKANTAAGLALALTERAPRAVLQVGVGGAYLGSFLSVGMAVVASEELHLDLGVRTAQGWQDLSAMGFTLTPASGDRPARANAVPTHPGLTRAVGRVASVSAVRFATLETVTGDVDVGAAMQREHDVSIESMEGAAAAQVCDRLGVPFAEVRGVSNLVGERDRSRWNLRAAAVAACDVAKAVLRRWPDLDETRALDSTA
jgi:futalosine hydrolase